MRTTHPLKFDWILRELGDEVPVHFTAFHPDFRLRDHPPTPPATLATARAAALKTGLKYVYTGNILDPDGQSTYCPACRRVLIQRNWYEVGEYHLRDNMCEFCGCRIAGHFDEPRSRRMGRSTPTEVSALLEEIQRTASAPGDATTGLGP
jgi:pyruvate formate lyase activating enzyme